MRSNFGCLALAIALSCAGSVAQVRPQVQQTTVKSHPAAKPNGTSSITANTSSSLPGLLKQQGALRVVSGQHTRYALASTSALIGLLHQQKQAGQISVGQTMASQTGLGSRLTAAKVARNATFSYVPSSLLTDQENRLCEQQEAQGKGPSILRVDSQASAVKFSPDAQANPYTIVGCGFGGNPGTIHLTLVKDETTGSGWFNSGSTTTVAVYTLNFTIHSWNDHEIVASLDPNTSAIPDWPYTRLEVKTRASGYFVGGQFIARRQTMLLAGIPQTESSLYPAGSPYFLSPVTDYYGLNGTAAVMRQGLSGPVAGQDQFNLKLAPGFSVDSTQTDLLVANIGSNISSQPATLNGNTITVTYPVFSALSGNSTIYYSIYGLKIWVTGPVGINPLVK